MASDPRVSPRERLVLTSIIEHYIETGEPVSSQIVARDFASRNGLSSATIRNVMAALAENGLLEQPHTSAGRIPTPRAFRYYVEHLGALGGALGQQHPSELTSERREQIDESFAGIHTGQQFLERTSHVLALLSSGVGIAVAAMQESHVLEHIHFSRLAPHRVLAVVVTLAGVVLDRMLLLDHDLSGAELLVAASYLNENFHGWPIDSIRSELSLRLEAERSEYDRSMRSLHELHRKGAFDDATTDTPVIYIEGVGNLLAAEADRERLRAMMSALETKKQLIELLTAYLDARQKTVRVIVGLEEAMPEMGNLVLIGAPALMGEENLGTVAVITPTRIQYQETINAVSYIAQLSGRLLQPQQ
jgi:heat-inducible transcriptional repressor